MGRPWEQLWLWVITGLSVKGTESSNLIASTTLSLAFPVHPQYTVDQVHTASQRTTSLCHLVKQFVPRLCVFLEWHATQNDSLPQDAAL